MKAYADHDQKLGKNTQMDIDHRDRILLKRLQADSRISNADLADAAGMSPSACWRRVKALEEASIIDRYGAVVNPAAAGLTFQAIVHVQLARHSADDLNAFIQAVSTRNRGCGMLCNNRPVRLPDACTVPRSGRIQRLS